MTTYLAMRKVAFAAVALVVAMTTGGAAHAIVLSGNVSNSTGHTGATFTADLTYSAATATSATLTLGLTNATPAAVGGFLTAFVLNNPGDQISTATLSSAPTLNWSLLGLGNSTVNGAPFGQFDFGATSGNVNGGFEGGGNPNTGLAAGTGGTFVFSLTGTNLNSLTDRSFVDTLSVGPGQGQGAEFFVARFRGLSGTPDSDKAPAAIPEPSTYAMLLAGLFLIGAVTRRLRS